LQLVRIVTPTVVGNSENPHRCNALIEPLSAVIFVRPYYASFDQIKSSVVKLKLVQKVRANQRSDRSLTSELIPFWSCSRLFFELK
jgi:hypothetical protein